MIAPDAIGLLTSDTSGSGTGLTWTRSGSNYTVTLSSSQSDTNYQIITDAKHLMTYLFKYILKVYLNLL